MQPSVPVPAPPPRHRAFARLLLGLAAGATGLLAQSLPSGTFIDIDASNTTALGGAPAPFFTDSATNTGFTAGNLWRRRAGFGFTVTGHREIFEKDANDGVGDATALVTTVTGLNPGQSYGVYVAFLSVASESWRVRAGLAPDTLQLFTPASPAGSITSHGISGETNSNRTQYLGFVGNATASAEGTLTLYSDDGDGTAANWSQRSWLEGFLVGDPYTPPPPPPPPGGSVEIAPDGAWTWFNDERSIIHQGSLFSGYVLSDGRYGVTRHDLADGRSYHAIISTSGPSGSQQRDDHNNPSLTVLPDGRILALYSKHIAGNRIFQRTSLVPRPASDADWGPEIIINTPAANTYANTYRLSAENGAIFNFSRCINFNPSLIISTDDGATWSSMRQLLGTGSGSTRPYPRYVSNNADRIDFIYTDGHPRDVANSVYHLAYRSPSPATPTAGFYKTDGTFVESLANIPLDHDGGERGSVLYQYSAAAWGPGQGPDDWIPSARGWTWDIAYDRDGGPVAVFQAQVGADAAAWTASRIYYYYATWTGTEWRRRFIAQAGRGIYAAESDYGGGMTLDPEDPRIVYISSNAADPFALDDVADVPLRANNRYEIWRGFTADGGLTFTWTPITENSTTDNLRPIVPPAHGRTECLVWFHGTYNSYTSFSTKVVARLGAPAAGYADWAAAHELGDAVSPTDDPDGDGVPNLLEYAFSGAPDDASSAPGLTLQPSDLSLQPSFLAFPFDPARTDTELVLERSEDLENWATVARLRPAGLPSETADGYTADIPAEAGLARIDIPTTPETPRLFFRVRADLVR